MFARARGRGAVKWPLEFEAAYVFLIVPGGRVDILLESI